MADLYKLKMFKRIGPGGFHCSCCNNSRGKMKNSHIGKNNTLNKKARKDLKYEIENINIKDILEEENYIKGE